MNNQRRKKIESIVTMLLEVKKSLSTIDREIDAVLTDEVEYLDSLSAGVRGSSKGYDSEKAIHKLRDASDEIEESFDFLEQASLYLERSIG